MDFEDPEETGTVMPPAISDARSRRRGVIESGILPNNSIKGRMTSLVRSSVDPGSVVRPPDNRIVINVGGVRFETYKTTLKNIPDTRLAWLTESTSQNNADYEPESGEYFFDRHSGVFAMILNYYRTGRLHSPMDVCGPMFEEELAFWGIDEKQMESCCWTTYRTHRDAQETLAELNDGESDYDEDEDADTARRFGIEEAAHPELSWWQRTQPRLWMWMEDRNSGTEGRILATISVFFILASIIVFMAETLPSTRVVMPNATEPDACNNTIPNNLVSICLANTTPHLSIIILDIIITVYFTIELFSRILLCPQKSIFFKSLLNWIDIVAVFTAYLSYVVDYLAPQNTTVVALQLLKMIRIFRIFKLTRHFSGLKILVHTMKASSKELFLLSIVFTIFVIICGTVIFIFEQIYESKDFPNKFKNIPIGFWWALVTMTTLGYGDVVPNTLPGYLVGGICAVSGVLVIALPVPIIVNNFALYYTHAQARLKLPKRKKRVLVGAPDALKQTMSVVEEADSIHSSGSSIRSSVKDDSQDEPDSCSDLYKNSPPHTNHTCKSPPGITVEFTDDNDNYSSNVTPTINLSNTVIIKPELESHHSWDESLSSNSRKGSVKDNSTLDSGNSKNNRLLRRGSLRPNGHAYSDDSSVAYHKEGVDEKEDEAASSSNHTLKPAERSPRERRHSLTPHGSHI